MSAMASQITGVFLNILIGLLGTREGNPPMTSGFPHQGPVTREMFPSDDIIMSRQAGGVMSL